MTQDDHSPDAADGPPVDPLVTDDLLDRYAGGECTPAEAERVGRWLAADPAPPGRRERVERLRAVWEASRRSSSGAPESWDVDAAWSRAAARLAESGRASRPAKVLSLEVRRPGRRVWLSSPALRAASLFFLLGTAALGWYFVAQPNGTVATAAVPAREYITARGERAILTLVDGTRVMLGAASKLIVPGDYGRAAGDTAAFTPQSSEGPRVVTLEGEGYFEVTHDDARPFAVRAGRGLVRDIGTKFVVRAYEPDMPVEVAVTEGEVALGSARLLEGDLGRLDTAGAVSVERDADLRPYTSWTEGRLVFHDTPLRKAIPVIERWYDIDITVADRSLNDLRLFATLTNEPVSQVLDLIALSFDLDVERQGRGVTLRLTPTSE